MKYSLLLSVVVMFTVGFNARADLPANDPVVQQIRNEFSAGSAPTDAQLQFGKSWECTWFGATLIDGGAYQTTDMYRFATYDGIYQNSPSFPAALKMDFFARNTQTNSLMSKIKGFVAYSAIRVNAAGDLIIELSAPIDSDWLRNTGRVPGACITLPGEAQLYARAYEVCPLAKVKN